MAEADRQLARILVRIELDVEQMNGVLLPSGRTRHRLPDASELVANPYLLAERYVPRRDGEPISFLMVDHALMPRELAVTKRWSAFHGRIRDVFRALLTDSLRLRGEQGDTFASGSDALAWAAAHSPEDRAHVTSSRVDLRPRDMQRSLTRPSNDLDLAGTEQLALREIAAFETGIRGVFDELAHRPLLSGHEIDWQALADELASTGRVSQLDLSDEQMRALDRSLRSPLSVITGAAGTGKSTLLAPLIAAIEQHEGRVPIRALAPTGKAADRLNRVGVDAMTIHRAIASAGWYDWDLGVWTDDGERSVAANTLIVDESSMVDVALLGTLFKAVDWHSVRRLVMVGDHHQLPPIGPGRPFFDLIRAMTSADEAGLDDPYADRLNELTHNYRVAEGSRAIALANSFARVPEPDDALIWTSLAKGEDQGDLRIRYWSNPEELHQLLLDEIQDLVRREAERTGLDPDDRYVFDKMFAPEAGFDASHWQIIGPVRGEAHGTRKLNAVIQDTFHGWAKRPNLAPNGAILRWPVKLGDEQVTIRDKVIQISNERLYARNRSAAPGTKNEKHPIFNGQIGIVRSEYPSANTKFRKGQKGPVRSVGVDFDGVPGLRFDYHSSSGKQSVDRNLELAYALTVHKSQGSQFPHVFFVLPAKTGNVGRELAYTGLTRGQESLTLFVERDIGPLLALSKRQSALTPQRNSRLFGAALAAPAYRPDGHVFSSTRGDLVLSKSEVIIANLLNQYERSGELSYAYEEVLTAPGGEAWDFRLPDFTVHARGQVFYWEHCGMFGDPAYKKRWDEVRSPWYTRNGLGDQLIVTYEDGAKGLRSDELEQQVILKQILGR